MNSQLQPVVYSPIGHCIYCGSNAGTLSKEHIIPLGLGGNLILPKASCDSCASITRDVEQFCLPPMLGPLRIRLDLPTRHRNDRPDKLPLEFIRVDGSREYETVPSKEFPFTVISFRFPAPGLLRNLAPNEIIEGKLIARVIDGELRKHITPEGQRVKIGSVNTMLFCRMLAKIAHSYAIANLGERSFRPLLPDLILGKSSTPSYLVGGDESAEPPETEPALHHIYLQNRLTNGVEYVLVAIRLFAFIGMPRYHIVVGEKAIS